ncbi:MAG: hypothetical protein DIZ80_04045 [endosymbiont of Galathealinum brachiosum]|uniref:Uncharacterized protein n=1 Tax=endosymbiont of Galathealinum brachiosum TaxID=2200906 RepID=A0A370DJ95_9GAMM|nr:MAG: hypothetical protein DIZ80_04045 [endosymbiont of Galathealinum brachiosum]
MAVSILEHCLNENTYYQNEFCWKKSNDVYNSCSRQVKQTHNSNERNSKRKAELKIHLEQIYDYLFYKLNKDKKESGDNRELLAFPFVTDPFPLL